MSVRIRLTGDLTVQGQTQVLEAGRLDGRLGRRTLAYLALAGGRPVPREELADAIWGERLPRTWETSLRVRVSRLRASLMSVGLGDPVGSARGCYALTLPDDATVDITDAEESLAGAERALSEGDPMTCSRLAEHVCSIASGVFLPGEDADWIEEVRRSLRDVHIRALDALSSSRSSLDRTSGALSAAEEAVALDPFRESAHRRLIAAHAEAGDRASALLAFERCRELLASELGVDPDPATVALHIEILRAEERARDDEPSAMPETSMSPAVDVPNNLPETLTSFVGRVAEIEAICEQLVPMRCLTLIGPGGVGKTRLAIEVASRLASDFADGVWYVDLAPITDQRLVIPVAVSVLGVTDVAEAHLLDALGASVSGRSILVILDNCEHMSDACGGLVSALLEASERVAIIATSRAPLDVIGEQVWTVPPMQVPDVGVGANGSDAVRLFMERAAAASPMFVFTDADTDDAAAICRNLDGIPLALELAAARVRMLAPGQILARLDDRLRFLTSGRSSDVPPRHQTLRTAIDWSHELLDPPARSLFRRLSVFTGRFTLDAAERVCAGAPVAEHEVLDVLTELVERSLVTREQTGSQIHFRLLETVRAYALEKLERSDAAGEAADIRDRHRAYVVDMVRRAQSEFEGPNEVEWLRRLDDEIDNLRSALAWRTDEVLLDLVATLGHFWLARGHLAEAWRWYVSALEGNPMPSAPRAHALGWAGAIAMRIGDADTAREYKIEALDFYRSSGDGPNVASTLYGLGELDLTRGDHAEARVHLREALAGATACRDESLVARCRYALAHLMLVDGDLSRADEHGTAALTAFRRSQNLSGIAAALGILARVALLGGDPATARARLAEGTDVSVELGDDQGVAFSLLDRADVDLVLGDASAARTHADAALAIAERLDDPQLVPLSLVGLGRAALVSDELDDARAFIERALKRGVEYDDRLITPIAHVVFAQTELAAARYASARAEAVAAVNGFEGLGDRLGLMHALAMVGAVDCYSDDPVGGVRLVSFARDAITAAGAVLSPVDLASVDAALGAAARLIDEQTFEVERTAAGELTLDDALVLAGRSDPRRDDSGGVP